MQELYKEVLIPNFERIQKELFDSITQDWARGETFAFNYTMKELAEKCPILTDLLRPINKVPFRLIRFYVTKPFGALREHIDGGVPAMSPFGLNIPVYGCENTKMYWHSCENSNMTSGKDAGYLGAIYPNDTTKMSIIEELELTKPYFVRNDIMHSVVNPNPTPRIMFTLRWPLNPKFFRTIEEVVNTDGLFV